MAELLARVRGARLDPSLRRLVRWWSARWLVRLVTGALTLVLMFNVVISWGDGDRQKASANAPSLDQLNSALGAAERYLDPLYQELPARRAVVAEYYGFPLVAHFPTLDTWVRPGDARVTVTGGELSRDRESAVYRYVLPGEAEPLTLLAVIRWDDESGRARIEVSQIAGTRMTVALQLGDRRLVRWSAGDTARVVTTVLRSGDQGALRSLRYTVRHVAMMSELAYRYRGDDDRAARLSRVVDTAGFDPDADVYAPAWGRGLRQPDDFVFASSVYRDCTASVVRDSMPDGASYYPYQSKVCTVPTPGYVAMTREDPLVPLAAALHVAEKYGDPERVYSGGEHLNVTPVRIAGDMEGRFRGAAGISECLPGTCDSGSTSTLRTAMFGALETELGYRNGDDVSRSYADAVAAGLLRVQVGQDGLIPTTAYGELYRPHEAGGFYTHVSADRRAGEPPSFTRRQLDNLASAFDIRPEYVGDISTNSETTLVVYAFLLRYRCARFAVACGAVDPTDR
jgi:hypothetical protein